MTSGRNHFSSIFKIVQRNDHALDRTQISFGHHHSTTYRRRSFDKRVASTIQTIPPRFVNFGGVERLQIARPLSKFHPMPTHFDAFRHLSLVPVEFYLILPY